MFGIDSTELLIIVVVAVIVIGPKDLPRALYKVGQVVGQARAMARHFRTGLDAMIREAELEELQKQWDKENARIMAAHPSAEPAAPEETAVEASATSEQVIAESPLDPDARIAQALSAPMPASEPAPVSKDETPVPAPEAPKGVAT